jgi:uncharacterized protein YegL
MSTQLGEDAIDVSNSDNSAERWQRAMQHYRDSSANIRSARSQGKIRCVAIMDTSYSMDGKRLICVKLGLCSLLANFEADDEVNVIKFDSKVTSVTKGFQHVSEVLDQAPQLLHSMLTDGCTAYYDAIVEGVSVMRDRASLCQSFAVPEKADSAYKNVAIVLTDGEDNESVHTAKSVERLLVNPRMKQFMFLVVAVDMTKQWERKFKSWMDLSHCKQVRVNVRTGSSLVGVFKEMLLCRILQTESTSPRFLQSSTAQGGSTDGLTEEEHLALRASQLRVNTVGGDEEEYGNDEDDNEDEDDGLLRVPRFTRNGSEGVSSVCSCSDGGDFDDWQRHDSDSDSDCDSDSDSDGDHSNLTNVEDQYIPPHLRRCSSSGSSGSESSELGISSTNMIVPDTYVEEEEDHKERMYPTECYCPISHCIMIDPVICADGHTYERKSIQSWLSAHYTSPNTNEELFHSQLVPNLSLRNLIQTLTNTSHQLISVSQV